jgi:hypothetical protein
MSSHHQSSFPRQNVPTDVPAIKVPHAGAGRIGRTTAIVVAILFLIGICIPAVYQTWYEERTLQRSEFEDLLMRAPTADSLKEFESNLTQQSRFDRWVRHTFWYAMTGGIMPPHGVQMGREGWLFSDEELRPYNTFSLDDPAPSPASTIMPAILAIQRQLAACNIHLVLLPIPDKLEIYPDKLAIDYPLSLGPAIPPGYADWLRRTRDAGVDVIDLTSALWQAKLNAKAPIYLPTDTHWSLPGRLLVADIVADHIRPLTADMPKIEFTRSQYTLDFPGDLAQSLSMGWGNTKYPHNGFRSPQVLQKDGKPLIPGNEAPILLMGDSFSLHFSENACGFLDDLISRLGVPIQVIGTLGGPIDAPRQILARNPAILSAKKVVIWEFAQRYMWRAWGKIDLK